MFIFRALVILVVAGLILGGSAYFAYELYWKPNQLDREDQIAKATQAAPTPPPDPSIPVFEKALAFKQSGDLEKAVPALSDFVRDYPKSPKAREAKAALGEINSDKLFGPDPEGKTIYTVVSGDSLVKIASKLKTNAELIFRLNNLESINLRVGQQLQVPQIESSLAIDRKGQTVTLLNKGQFFKEYPSLSFKIPGGSSATPVQAKIADKLALNGANRVAFGEKNYADSDRWLMVSGNITIRGMPEGSEENPPHGIILSRSDMEEIFLLTGRGSPVTIY